MLEELKIAAWKVLSTIHILPLKWKGVQFGKNCFIDGKPYVRTAKGSRIILGDDVTLISRERHNPLIKHEVMLTTVTPSAEIRLGNHVGISGCNIVCSNKVSIGDYTIIGPNTTIYDSEGHHYSPDTGWRVRSVRSGSPISIGRKCYIGAECTILSGVTIGDNCVVSAGSIVTRDVPAGHRASGNPATCEPLPKLLGGPGKKHKTNTEEN